MSPEDMSSSQSPDKLPSPASSTAAASSVKTGHGNTTSTAAADRESREREKKRRASKACSCCRARKVRCDVLEVGLPCTKCRVDGFDCAVQERKKRRRKNELVHVDGLGGGAVHGHGGPGVVAGGARNLPGGLGNGLGHGHSPGSGNGSGDHTGSLKLDGSTGASSMRLMPQHTMLHQVPHYPFFRSFTSHGGSNTLPPIEDKDPESAFPVSPRDQDIAQGGYQQKLGDDDVQFLRHKGVFDLPRKQAMDEFVSNYFQIFHPFFPIVDKYKFLDSYYQSDFNSILDRRRGPSLLLLQAILFTASATIPMNVLRDCGFISRKQARSVLHRKCRYLYDFDFESDDVTTIQSLLLMSHYYPSMVEQKHTWFWVHQAISLAQGAGLHRDAGQAPQRKLWARIWWACLVRDRMVTLGTGRPMHINSLDCSVPMLTPIDLEEEGDSEDDRTVKAIFVEFVRLCQYMEGVLSLPHSVEEAANSLPDQITLCETTLQHWRDNLTPAARRREESGPGSEKRGVCALYRATLHMIYNIVVIALHQSHQVLDDTRSGGAQPPPPKVQIAAEDSTRLAIELVDLDLVKFCPTICVTAILPPLIVHLLMMRSSNDRAIKPFEPARFDRCLVFLKQLSEIYWHASFYHEFFQLAQKASNSNSGGGSGGGKGGAGSGVGAGGAGVGGVSGMSGLANGEKDPLVAFLNERMPARQIFGKISSEPHSQSTSRKRTPMDADDDNTHAMDEPAAKRFDSENNSNNKMNGRHAMSNGDHPHGNHHHHNDIRSIGGLLSGPPGSMPNVSAPSSSHGPMSAGIPVSEMTTGAVSGPGTAAAADMSGLMDVNVNISQPFEDLLDDVGYFHSIFPSA